MEYRYLQYKIVRNASVKPSGVIVATIATDTPFKGEVLLMSGVAFRGDKRQLPLLDHANATTVKAIVGSCRQVRIENGKLIGNVLFASDKSAQAVKRKFLDGHLSQFAASIEAISGIELRVNESFGGYLGPMRLITRWRPLAVVITA